MPGGYPFPPVPPAADPPQANQQATPAPNAKSRPPVRLPVLHDFGQTVTTVITAIEHNPDRSNVVHFAQYSPTGRVVCFAAWLLDSRVVVSGQDNHISYLARCLYRCYRTMKCVPPLLSHACERCASHSQCTVTVRVDLVYVQENPPRVLDLVPIPAVVTDEPPVPPFGGWFAQQLAASGRWPSSGGDCKILAHRTMCRA